MKNAAIFATDSHPPETAVPNEMLTCFLPASLGSIVEKTDILSKRTSPEEACATDLAVQAACRWLQKLRFPLEALRGIVLSTTSPERMQPATATRVQHMLGATNAFAFDINSVCSEMTFRTFPLFGGGAGAILFHTVDTTYRGVRHSCLKTDAAKAMRFAFPPGRNESHARYFD
jgi:3-oxoacyl-[acyl-carrier-protein] synthase-3